MKRNGLSEKGIDSEIFPTLRPASVEEAGLFYSNDEQDDALGTVGHLRMDFGSGGKEFHHTWWPHNGDHFNTPEFKEALQEFVDALRKDGPLKSLAGMNTYCWHNGGEITENDRIYGFIAETNRYRFCLRCTPRPGDYQGYLYQKYGHWTEVSPEDSGISAYQLPYDVTTAYSADPSITLGMFVPQPPQPNRAPANSSPTGGVGAYNPGSPGGQKPHTSNVAWAVDPERTFLRFTLIEFPQGVVTDLNTQDWNTWHVVGTPLNVVWSNGWSAEQCRSDITWYNSSALQYNAMGANAPQLMAGTSVSNGVYSYDATVGYNQRWVTTADEFQAESGITNEQKAQMFHLNSSAWSTGWINGDYTSMWGTDPQSVTPGNLYQVYKANDAFLYLLGRLTETDNGSGGSNPGWSKDEAMEKWSEYVKDRDGNLRTKYRIIVETGIILRDPDGGRRAYTLRDMMAYSLYNNEASERYNLTAPARWRRCARRRPGPAPGPGPESGLPLSASWFFLSLFCIPHWILRSRIQKIFCRSRPLRGARTPTGSADSVQPEEDRPLVGQHLADDLGEFHVTADRLIFRMIGHQNTAVIPHRELILEVQAVCKHSSVPLVVNDIDPPQAFVLHTVVADRKNLP